MNAPFRLDEHRRAWPQPLSAPPAGYFDKLPTRIMTQVQPPATQPALLSWLGQVPASLRTGLASTLLLGTFAASFWLGTGSASRPELASPNLEQVPRTQLMDYLLTNEAHVDLSDMAELAPTPLGITKQYLRPSAQELTEALDAQPSELQSLL
jgi:hypothetical protein